MKTIKLFKDIEVGMMAMENPAAGGVWDNQLGPIVWKGSYAELKAHDNLSEYALDWEDFDEDDEEVITDYNLCIIDEEDHGYTLYNYNCDPCGAVVFDTLMVIIGLEDCSTL